MNKKYFISYMLLLLILSGCSNTIIKEKENKAETISVNKKIQNETKSIVNNNIIAKTKTNSDIMDIMKLKQKYFTPWGEYDLELEISLDSWKISNVNAYIQNPGPVAWAFVEIFQSNINSVVSWMTLSEATQINNVSWASLTTWAFIRAINTKL